MFLLLRIEEGGLAPQRQDQGHRCFSCVEEVVDGRGAVGGVPYLEICSKQNKIEHILLNMAFSELIRNGKKVPKLSSWGEVGEVRPIWPLAKCRACLKACISSCALRKWFFLDSQGLNQVAACIAPPSRESPSAPPPAPPSPPLQAVGSTCQYALSLKNEEKEPISRWHHKWVRKMG